MQEYYVSIITSFTADYFVKASSEDEAREKAQIEFETQELNLPENWEFRDCDNESDFYVEERR